MSDSEKIATIKKLLANHGEWLAALENALDALRARVSDLERERDEALESAAERAQRVSELSIKIAELRRERDELSTIAGEYHKRTLAAAGMSVSMNDADDDFNEAIHRIESSWHQPGDIVFRKDGEPRNVNAGEIYLPVTGGVGPVCRATKADENRGLVRQILRRIDIPAQPEGEKRECAGRYARADGTCTDCGKVQTAAPAASATPVGEDMWMWRLDGVTVTGPNGTTMTFVSERDAGRWLARSLTFAEIDAKQVRSENAALRERFDRLCSAVRTKSGEIATWTGNTTAMMNYVERLFTVFDAIESEIAAESADKGGDDA